MFGWFVKLVVALMRCYVIVLVLVLGAPEICTGVVVWWWVVLLN